MPKYGFRVVISHEADSGFIEAESADAAYALLKKEWVLANPLEWATIDVEPDCYLGETEQEQ
jgi:hypothetical protein